MVGFLEQAAVQTKYLVGHQTRVKTSALPFLLYLYTLITTNLEIVNT